jgi:putative flippase GtrA
MVPVLKEKSFICNAFMKSILGKFFTIEFLKFVVVGVISAAIEFSLLFLLKKYIDYRAANIFAFVITNVFTFILTRRYVFTTTGNKAEEQKLFILCLVGALAVNHVVLWSLVEFGSVDMRLAKVTAIGITVIWNFLTRKHIVFRNREIAAETSTAPAKDFPSKRF